MTVPARAIATTRAKPRAEKSQGRAAFNLGREGMRHDLAEAGHVEHEAFFQLEPTVRGDRLAERKEVYEAPRAVLHPMR